MRSLPVTVRAWNRLLIRTEPGGILVRLLLSDQLSWNSTARRRTPRIVFPCLHLRLVFRLISHPVTRVAVAAAAHPVLVLVGSRHDSRATALLNVCCNLLRILTSYNNSAKEDTIQSRFNM